ncbi:MAG: hypothetical protein JRI44_10450, partial [Deltaproteobacteria bacterium]|nr:hypothetical protein [Deltaproteobacteria bacterium]
RLYRLTEMTAQYILKKEFSIDTGDVDINNVPINLKEQIENLKNPKDNRIQLAMFQAFQLLMDLGISIGKDFFKNTKLRGLISERNYSILAHGTKSITKDTALNLTNEIHNFIAKYFDKFDEVVKELSFNWQAPLIT